MTIIGIAGCCALLLTGFGLSDSINDIIAKQFDNIQYDNFNAVFDTSSTDDAYQKAIDIAKQNDDKTQYAFIHEENLVAIPESKPECSVLLDVPQDIEQFKQLRKAQTRNKQKNLDIEDDTILINEKLSTLMNVKVGDTITLYEQDKIGNAGTKSYSFKIGGIFENYIAHYIYMNEKTYQNTFGQKPTFNTFLARYISDENSKENFLHNIQTIEHVKMANFTDQNKESYQKMMSSVDMVVIVLIVFAGILAFVVLYNLTNINICERQREIATLKVLGVKSHELFFYIHRETVILSLIGALVGIALGFVMENFVILSAEIDYVMFGRNIYAPSIIYSILITLGFTIIVTIFTRKKINNISMVESLKSIE